MLLLISDILEYLIYNTTIPGFTRKRLEFLTSDSMQEITGFELRLLVHWSGLYVYQFENLYGVYVSEILELKEIILTNKKIQL